MYSSRLVIPTTDYNIEGMRFLLHAVEKYLLKFQAAHNCIVIVADRVALR